MAIYFSILILTTAVSFILAGCVSYPTSISDIMAAGHSDIDKARDTDIAVTFKSTRASLFSRVIHILEENKLVVYQKSPRKDYIIAMGFPKQTNTTRVGIYFTSKERGVTTVTLSSLSATCLEKADNMIMKRLKNTNSTL